ncbi:acetyl-CoA carboxylase biotin carboxyl carrier protein subunit [Candidatus Bathyarchaeota archaeon]|nr:MAG: acetyl-CoA carboxylase biotin carboxyl carrier protein subunit [Candidatus Bathyarchaeota archaeon]
MPARDYSVRVDGRTYRLRVEEGPDGSIYVSVGGRKHVVKLLEGPSGEGMRLAVDGRDYEVEVSSSGSSALQVVVGGRSFRVEVGPERPIRPGPGGAERPGRASAGPRRPRATVKPVRGAILSPMPGKVVSLKVGAGEAVRKGDVLLIIEAMKMENEIRAPRDGVVREVLVSEGSSVSTGQPLLVLD